MPELPDFQSRQYAFAAHIRDPDNVPVPDGIDDRRMAVYRELFFNNLRNLLGNMFPVLRKLHPNARWNELVRQFMCIHRAATPYFLQLPREFLAFLQDEYQLQDDDFPFLLELAHYEYVELALSIAEAGNDPRGVDPGGDLLEQAPAKSSLAWVYAYTFPVHRIGKTFMPCQPAHEPVFLAVYRRSDDSVGFLELNPISARLLETVENNDQRLPGAVLLRQLADEIGYENVEGFVAHGKAALEKMRQLEILTGTRVPA